MPRLLRSTTKIASFNKNPDQKKSKKGLYIGAGLLGGTALLGGGLLLTRRKIPKMPSNSMPPQNGYHQPKQPVSVDTTRIYPKPLTPPQVKTRNNQPKQLGYVDAVTVHSKSSSNQLLLPAAKQSNSTNNQLLLPAAKQSNSINSTASNSLSLTKRQRNSALIHARKQLYEPELRQLRQARSVKQNLDINPRKYKSKRAGRYKTLRNQYDSAKQAIRQKYDNHW